MASSGIGSMPHLAIEQLAEASQANLMHVPYKGAAPAITIIDDGQGMTAPQFDQALTNILDILAVAGTKGEHICRMTAYCCDKQAYLAARPELGAVWRTHMGAHYPAMSLLFVSDLLDHPGCIELEATAVVP